jgi:hypothetical protein
VCLVPQTAINFTSCVVGVVAKWMAGACHGSSCITSCVLCVSNDIVIAVII